MLKTSPRSYGKTWFRDGKRRVMRDSVCIFLEFPYSFCYFVGGFALREGCRGM
jgi:hypothetical protein